MRDRRAGKSFKIPDVNGRNGINGKCRETRDEGRAFSRWERQ